MNSEVKRCTGEVFYKMNNSDKIDSLSKNIENEVDLKYSKWKDCKKEIIEILRWMYNDKGDFYLRRKYAKVQDKIC